MIGKRKWSMVVDIDKCTGCQACVVACQSENNIPINTEDSFKKRRAIQWIRIERYWEGEFPNAKVRFIPLLCQHCDNAPCEPVCPVYATYHNQEGLNVQVYNRCIGSRLCVNNCPYHIRFFNFWEPNWPDSLKNQLNPDVTVRSRGIMEKCTFCIQRISRTTRESKKNNQQVKDGDRRLNPACVNACPTDALVFGDLNYVDSVTGERSKVAKLKEQAFDKNGRGYKLMGELGTEPNVTYLKKVDVDAGHSSHG
jgi:Fe-S-cluster-containing dehydrogenase component